MYLHYHFLRKCSEILPHYNFEISSLYYTATRSCNYDKEIFLQISYRDNESSSELITIVACTHFSCEIEY